MTVKKLSTALGAVDWNNNVTAFLADDVASETVAKSCARIAIWSRQLEATEIGNPALSFVREMQIAGQNVAALAALGLYKAAAGAIRTLFESALYYTFFRSHPVELATLARDTRYFIQKSDLIDYHKKHTPNFLKLQEPFGLLSKQDVWYNKVSAVIHGQIPGAWVDHQALDAVAYKKATLHLVATTFQEGEELVHYLLLCTIGVELWSVFGHAAKKNLLAGLSGEAKAALGLDIA